MAKWSTFTHGTWTVKCANCHRSSSGSTATTSTSFNSSTPGRQPSPSPFFFQKKEKEVLSLQRQCLLKGLLQWLQSDNPLGAMPQPAAPAPRHKRPAEAASSSAVSVPKLAPTAKNSPSSGQVSSQVQGQVNPAPAPAPAPAAAPPAAAPAPSPAAAPAPGDPSVGPPTPLLNSVQKLVFQRFISNNVIPGYVTNYLFNLC